MSGGFSFIIMASKKWAGWIERSSFDELFRSCKKYHARIIIFLSFLFFCWMNFNWNKNGHKNPASAITKLDKKSHDLHLFISFAIEWQLSFGKRKVSYNSAYYIRHGKQKICIKNPRIWLLSIFSLLLAFAFSIRISTRPLHPRGNEMNI